MAVVDKVVVSVLHRSPSPEIIGALGTSFIVTETSELFGHVPAVVYVTV
ncbi:hypothetical protein JCM19300_2254 [Algibacter lectus]|uniref:Uncharacterized protein n=1 Tax=Algibacter lectus TaxID=221126 RepID=A0A090VH91_9FLAO|nr:hypothetical protein JCM19300_2254 [Algibacter lectus]